MIAPTKCYHGQHPELPRQRYIDLQDLNIGCILPQHQYAYHALCSDRLMGPSSLQRAEAIAFTIREINTRTDLLPNVTLGFIMYDDCAKDQTALLRAIQLAKFKDTSRIVNPDANLRDILSILNVIGVVGSESSDNTVQIANFLTSFGIPQMSFMATSKVLSDKNRYPYFQRTVPSDVNQAKAIIEVLIHFNWSFVSVVYQWGHYGMEGIKAIKKEAEDAGICFGEAREISHDDNHLAYESIMDHLLRKEGANVVIVFTSTLEARRLLMAAKNKNATGRFVWIASDGWGHNIRDLDGIEDLVVGSIFVNIFSTGVDRFNRYFKTLGPANIKQNPWLTEFWETNRNCTIKGYCSNNISFGDLPDYRGDTAISLTMDTIYTFAYALDKVVKEKCTSYIPDLKMCIRKHLPSYMRKVQFRGTNGRTVSFNEQGDSTNDYIVSNFQKINGTYRFVQLGTFKTKRGKMEWLQDVGLIIKWPNSTTRVPKSVCSDACEQGEEQVVGRSLCCWTCEPCSKNEITEERGGRQKCRACAKKFWPNDTRTGCIRLKPEYLRYNHPLAVFFIMLAIGGIGFSAAMFVLFILNNHNVLIKACSRELSYTMLVGVAVSYSMVFSFIGRPTNAKCILNATVVPISLTLIYASLITKTNRIYRIFETGRRSAKRPRLIDSTSQMVIALTIVFIHVSSLTK